MTVAKLDEHSDDEYYATIKKIEKIEEEKLDPVILKIFILYRKLSLLKGKTRWVKRLERQRAKSKQNWNK